MADKDKKTFINAALAGIAEDTVRRFGSGIKEHLVALNGIDRDIDMSRLAVGKTVLFNWNGTDVPVVIKNISGRNNIQVEIVGDKLHTQLNLKANDINGVLNKRGLASIAQSKVNPEFAEQNLKQQAGFSAEVKEVGRQRAEEAVAGKNPKTVRTDDLSGHVNDPFFDITCEVDAKGNPIPGASAQMKFVGSSPEAAVDKMLTKQYQKYHDNDVKIMVPKDYYPGMKEALQNKITSLEDQISTMRAKGYSQDAINNKVKQLENCKTLQKNLLESKVTNAEAMEARTNPTLSTAKDIAKLAHRAGVQQAAMGAAVGGGVSIVRNAVALYKGDKRSIEALKDVAVDTAGAAGVSYVTGFGGAAIKGTMQNSSSAMLRGISKTNLPAYIATSTLEISKTMHSYFSGKIDSTECLEELGEKGYGMVTSAMFAAVGQVVIPIPILGAMAGSMLGYALSSASYHILLDSMKEAKLAREERIRIEKECDEAVKMLQEYRKELEKFIDDYLKEAEDTFNEVITAIKDKLAIGDADGYLREINKIIEFCGEMPVAKSKKEVDDLMSSSAPIKL